MVSPQRATTRSKSQKPAFSSSARHRMPFLQLARCGGLAGKRLTVALFATARHFDLWRAVPISRELLRSYNPHPVRRLALNDRD
jgi:hypothetical protein